RRVAACTWAIDADAIGVTSKEANSSSWWAPRSDSITSTTSGYGTGGTRSRHDRSSSASTSGNRPGLEATSWASLTYVGPSSSNASRTARAARTGRGAVPGRAADTTARPNTRAVVTARPSSRTRKWVTSSGLRRSMRTRRPPDPDTVPSYCCTVRSGVPNPACTGTGGRSMALAHTTAVDGEVPAGPIEVSIDLGGIHPGDVARLVEVVTTLARHGVVTAARQGPYIALRLRRRAPRALAVALRRSFVDLGPTFVKFGQLIASSPGLFPTVAADEFRSLLDEVPSLPTPVVHRIVERSLGRPVHLAFDRFDDEPLAAASIAQVHRARLHDGTEVVVKVRRPGLRDKVSRDVRLLRGVAAVLGRAGGWGQMMNPVAIVDDFAQTLRYELDFRNEAHWMAEFRANLSTFGDNRHVTTPVPVPGMCHERVLVMTYVEGHPVD